MLGLAPFEFRQGRLRRFFVYCDDCCIGEVLAHDEDDAVVQYAKYMKESIAWATGFSYFPA
jgi:hypothetical protein